MIPASAADCLRRVLVNVNSLDTGKKNADIHKENSALLDELRKQGRIDKTLYKPLYYRTKHLLRCLIMGDTPEQLLLKIGNLMSRKRVEVYELCGTPDDAGEFVQRFSETQHFDPELDFAVSLLQLEATNLFPNVVRGRNSLFTYNDGAGHKQLELETGAYEVSDINRHVQARLGNENIVIELDKATGQSHIKLRQRHTVSFGSERDFRRLLGYAADAVLARASNVSPGTCDLLETAKIFVELDVVKGSWRDGHASQTLYSFSNCLGFGRPIEIRPKVREEHLLIARTFSELRLRFSNERNAPVTFMKTPVLLTLEIR